MNKGLLSVFYTSFLASLRPLYLLVAVGCSLLIFLPAMNLLAKLVGDTMVHIVGSMCFVVGIICLTVFAIVIGKHQLMVQQGNDISLSDVFFEATFPRAGTLCGYLLLGATAEIIVERAIRYLISFVGQMKGGMPLMNVSLGELKLNLTMANGAVLLVGLGIIGIGIYWFLRYLLLALPALLSENITVFGACARSFELLRSARRMLWLLTIFAVLWTLLINLPIKPNAQEFMVTTWYMTLIVLPLSAVYTNVFRAHLYLYLVRKNRA